MTLFCNFVRRPTTKKSKLTNWHSTRWW